ncbi:MAG: UbiX family flavin prenyltransferase [Desulfomicrobium sp.]|jgi:4-hydroxy-3-polyprenylbenzoate decarboxylase|nr:UbiX family flavin prenyltransferase [Desulfomicrobium sp.]
MQKSNTSPTPQRIIVAISGASGIRYALLLMRALRALPDVEVHGIISPGAQAVIKHETKLKLSTISNAFHILHQPTNIAAAPASGSWHHNGMIVCPCSMASLAAIASGVGTNLIHRAADVCLKEGRPLILVPRETPLNEIHLRNMLRAHQAGATIMPPCPGFYHQPQTMDQLMWQFIGRILEQLHLPHNLYARWS